MPRLRKPYTYRTLFGGILKKDWSDVFYRMYFEKKNPGYFDQDIYTLLSSTSSWIPRPLN